VSRQREFAHVRRIEGDRGGTGPVGGRTPYIDPSVHQRPVEDVLSVRRPRRSGRDGAARRVAKRHTPFADPAGLGTPIHRLYVPGRIVGVPVNRGLLRTEGNEPAV